MADLRLLWGDLHTHLEDLDAGDAILRAGRDNVDFCAVLCYPFVWERHAGFRVESTRNRPEFAERWQRLRELNRAHCDPGEFTTFLGYEWHGNRTRYGDHNVIYLGEDEPLDDAWELPELFAHLRSRQALALPHHTGYAAGWRGKDWDCHDDELSPVMEVFSAHGSSEGVDTPLPMAANGSMAPRVSGGTYQDALARGLRIGAIASNDGPGLPGRWGLGRAAVWAERCTREAIWEALKARRAYAATGDRIELDLRVAGQPMGAVVAAGDAIVAEVEVRGAAPVDRIELVLNGEVADTYCHGGRWQRCAPGPGRYKVRIEWGWGPATHYGFPPGPDLAWQCRLGLEGARLLGVERCFTVPGNRLVEQRYDGCAWHSTTARRGANHTFGMTQALVVEVEGHAAAHLHLEMDGQRLSVALADLLLGSRLVPLVDEAREAVQRELGLTEREVANPDAYFHNARKVLLHRAVPEAAYRVRHAFADLPLKQGSNYLYVRASQVNGQLAWSSPVWLEKR
ncbi:MAG: DUF3604 domain-containing protein [Gemmatimonadota bacterium]